MIYGLINNARVCVYIMICELVDKYCDEQLILMYDWYITDTIVSSCTFMNIQRSSPHGSMRFPLAGLDVFN